MSKFGARARAIFDRIFPERQIYIRSCGSVRGVLFSPGKQVLAALCALLVMGWCGYASSSALGESSRRLAEIADFARDHAKYERWLNEARAQAAAVESHVEQRIHRLDDISRELENRHHVLRRLLEYAGGASLPPPSSPVEHADVIDAGPIEFLDGAGPYAVRAVAFNLHQAAAPGNPSQSESAAPAVEPSPYEFADYLSDPVLAERVAIVAGRIPAARSMRP